MAAPELGLWSCPASLSSPEASLPPPPHHRLHPSLSLASAALPKAAPSLHCHPSACRAESTWPRYFPSHQHKPNPDLSPRWLSRALPEPWEMGETPGCPCPFLGVQFPLSGRASLAALGWPGSWSLPSARKAATAASAFPHVGIFSSAVH